MNETSKTRQFWGELEQGILRGRGIDIGCGPDPVAPDALAFDLDAGDANRVDDFVHEQFDYVYSSHCLEHMHAPAEALQRWWKLVRPGGHLFFIVPDEDLYEQGFFPSVFNGDHKATFTISKASSWSPVSHNVLDLVRALPNGEIVQLVLQDHNLDRSRLSHPPAWMVPLLRPALVLRRGIVRRAGAPAMRAGAHLPFLPVDQTARDDVLGQIQCIVRKLQ